MKRKSVAGRIVGRRSGRRPLLMFHMRRGQIADRVGNVRGGYDYVAISVEPENISVIPASLRTPEIFHLNAKSPDTLMVADRFRFPRRTRRRGPWGSRPTTAGAVLRLQKTMSEQLRDYVLVRQVAGVKNQTFGVQAFLFRGKCNYKLVIWNINGEQRILRIEGALQDARVVNVFGRPIQLERCRALASEQRRSTFLACVPTKQLRATLHKQTEPPL